MLEENYEILFTTSKKINRIFSSVLLIYRDLVSYKWIQFGFFISTDSTKKYITLYYGNLSFSFHAHQTLLSRTKRIQIPSSSRSSKLTYIMCLERRFFSRGSGALRHAGQDSTDQWPSAAHGPPLWHHTFHNTDPKDAHTKRIWSFNLCLFVQRKLVFLLLLGSFLGFVLLCFLRAVLLCNLTF